MTRKIVRRQISDGKLINKAYNELTVHTFAVWMRLMVCTEEELSGGLMRLARLLNYSDRRFREITHELRRCGYIKIVKEEEFPRTINKISLLRRAVLSGNDHFIKL